jgi:hypothetical protein
MVPQFQVTAILKQSKQTCFKVQHGLLRDHPLRNVEVHSKELDFELYLNSPSVASAP